MMMGVMVMKQNEMPKRQRQAPINYGRAKWMCFVWAKRRCAIMCIDPLPPAPFLAKSDHTKFRCNCCCCCCYLPHSPASQKNGTRIIRSMMSTTHLMCFLYPLVCNGWVFFAACTSLMLSAFEMVLFGTVYFDYIDSSRVKKSAHWVIQPLSFIIHCG